jgi:hypothetical protein
MGAAGMGAAGTGAAGTGKAGSGAAGTGAAGMGAAGTGAAGMGAAGTGAASLSYATDIAPIIANKCKTCHTTDNPPKAGMKITFDTLVTNGTVTNTQTVNCSFMMGSKKRVVPGSPDTSLLWIKISKTKTELTATTAKCDDPMPEGGAVLTADEKTKIRDWIMGGAKP